MIFFPRDVLTDRQCELLAFIREHHAKHGYPPTFREMASALGVASTNGINDHLRALEKKGYIERQDLKSRAIKVLEPVLKP